MVVSFRSLQRPVLIWLRNARDRDAAGIELGPARLRLSYQYPERLVTSYCYYA